MSTIEIPPFVIEYFLLGRTRKDAMERYTQDGGIGTDVWLGFGRDREAPQRLLLAPSENANTMAVASALNQAIRAYRRSDINRRARRPPNISPLDSFVAATLHFDEMLRVVLPLTTWWHHRQLSSIRRKAARNAALLEMHLEQAILYKLGHGATGTEASLRKQVAAEDGEFPLDQRILQAASVAALIGVFLVAESEPAQLAGIADLDPKHGGSTARFIEWIRERAPKIAFAARHELARQFEESMVGIGRRVAAKLTDQPVARFNDDLPELVQRVFLDRRAVLADTEALATVKADAADRLFEVSCRSITWAVIDSGIAAGHPAFVDHDPPRARRNTEPPPARRVRAAYDFTRIDRIRSYDLTLGKPGSPEREREHAAVVSELLARRGWQEDAAFKDLARKNLELIAKQLERQLSPDWSLVEPLIRLDPAADPEDDRLVSDHGTHVAGILAGDWRKTDKDKREQVVMRGVCRDINLYDFRVVHESDHQSSEFALLAALEFIRYLNDRAGPNGPVVAGVNISLSIPYDVRIYGCGATPICVACDKLSNSGVVVVAAAGNRGWNEEEMGFGTFSFCSITDPGNAREVITVGATHRLRPHVHGVSYFSSRGPTGDGRLKPDLVAPGEKIRGPVRGNSDEELDGTSMAAPFVSGAAAMLLSRHRELIGNPARVKQILCDSATDLGREKYFQGHGLVDVLRALQAV